MFERFRGKKPTRVKSVNLKTQISEYYEQAHGWAYDCFDAVIVSRNRYKGAFYAMCGVTCLLALSICFMMPLHKISPIVIYTDSNGIAWVQQPYTNYKFNHTLAQTKAEIFQYIRYHESYDPNSFKVQSSYVRAMSSIGVLTEYGNDISTLVNTYGAEDHVKVRIESIQFLPHNDKSAIARFTTENTINGITKAKHIQVMLTWEYHGLPKDPNEQFMNYDGFTVTSYNKSTINFE